MQAVIENTANFVDRRQSEYDGPPGVERRQFADGREGTRPEVKELAEAVDQYKLRHRRRFITFEELHAVMASLGYRKA